MTKEELEKEAKDFWWNDDNCSGALPTEKIYECGYLAGAEPREKQIAELSKHIVELQEDKGELTDKVKELEAQIEKLIDFVLSKTECCDICPITDTCINSEGTCLYAGILSKGEEAVTREWLMQKIAKEIKEK